MQHEGVYSCNWSFSTTGGSDVAEVGTVHGLHVYDETSPTTELGIAAENFTDVPAYGAASNDPGLKRLTPYTKTDLINQMNDWYAMN
jgi:hypothetical protein